METIDFTRARKILRTPSSSFHDIEMILSCEELMKFYEIKRLLVLHPKVPRYVAVDLVASLFWRDLMEVGVSTRVHPIVRRAADNRLIEKLRVLTVGEKVALARRASHRVLSHLRYDPTVRVISAMLDNPRATEGLVVSLAGYGKANPKVLEVVAKHEKWGRLYNVKVALCRNPQTPLSVSVTIVDELLYSDIEAIFKDDTLPYILRRKCQLLLSGQDTLL